ncbi:MAG: TIGR00730 family Rossman fold protein [Clostridiales bacterium]|nr:TIGR00730 family Rossman fold protein [Clostridiales bacterium]
MNICVFGSGIEHIDNSYKEVGYELGKLIGKSKHTLVFGAGSIGMMGAVADGAASEGGYIIGILPEKLNETSTPSKHINEKIVTKTMHERKILMEDMADVFVICPGGFGTFEEIAEVISLKRLDYFSIPIIFLNTNDYYNKLFEMFEVCVSENFASERILKLYEVARTPKEVFEMIDGVIKRGS